MDAGKHQVGMVGGQAMAPSNNNGTTMMHRKMMMHMTFYWGSDALVLFHGWPGTNTGMYVIALILVFLLSVSTEWLSRSRFIKQGAGHVSAGLVQTLLHTIRIGLSYLVMLAVMSFNGGIFIAAVAGHAVGFFVFGSRVFKQNEDARKQNDLSPMTC